MSKFVYKTKVEYPDLDINKKMGIKGFLKMMQEAAGMHSATCGYGINDTEKTGVTWVILNWKLEIKDFPKCNDIVTVTTWPKAFTKIGAYRDFIVTNENNDVLAIASSKWILVDSKTHMIKKITEEVKDSYGEEVKEKLFEEKMKEKLTEPENEKLLFKYKIQRRDLDTNRHVNNLTYIDFAINSLPEEVYENNVFKNAEVMYKKELKLNDNIQCYYSKENEKHVVTIKSGEEEKSLHAIIRLY